MTPIYTLIAIIVVIGVVAGLLKEKFDTEDEKRKYDYKRRNWFLTKAEHDFYDALVQAVGQDYIIFAQAHLPTLLDEKDRKSTRLNSSHLKLSRMPSSA